MQGGIKVTVFLGFLQHTSLCSRHLHFSLTCSLSHSTSPCSQCVVGASPCSFTSSLGCPRLTHFRLPRIQDTYAHCGHIYRLVYITLCFFRQRFILDPCHRKTKLFVVLLMLPSFGYRARSSPIPFFTSIVIVSSFIGALRRSLVQIQPLPRRRLRPRLQKNMLAIVRFLSFSLSLSFFPCLRYFASVI